jgi:hypothetical protein
MTTKPTDRTQKPQQTQNAAENNCEKQAVHSFFQRRSGFAAASAFALWT